MKASRIPVWLITGFLGSGKTTLLAKWLRDPELADAALIVNEIGEVGFDDHLLASSAGESTSLIANGCVCCTGLPGLEEALANLFWDRLHRKRPAFSQVLIETTGLADPRNVIDAFSSVPLLAERYRLAGVITTVSAVAGCAQLEAHAEARAQVRCADAVIVTKMDRVNGVAAVGPLLDAVMAINSHVGYRLSGQASLDWLGVSPRMADPQGQLPVHTLPAAHGHCHDTHHHAEASFTPMPEPLARTELSQRLRTLQSQGQLLRLKGVVQLDDQSLVSVQWSVGDVEAALQPFKATPPSALGLTCIVRSA